MQTSYAQPETSQKISNSLNDSIAPSIATDGINIYVAWADRSRSGPSEIFFSKSTDGGKTFTESKNISNKQGGSNWPFVVTDGTNIYVAWTYRYPNNPSGGWSDDNSEILFSKSTDGGKTFSNPQIISDSVGFSDGPSIATDGKNIFNAWSWAERSSEDRQVLVFSKFPISPSLTGNNASVLSPDEPKEPAAPNDAGIPSVKNIEWLDENGANYSIGGIGIIRMNNSELNVNKQLIDIPVVHVWSNTDTKGIQVQMIETGADTGVFYADVTLSGSESSHLQIHVSNGDTLTASFEDKSDEPLSDTIKIISKYVSPRKQLELGTLVDQIQCKDGLVLAKNTRTGDPMCLKPQTLAKLKERNWIQ